jgi:hypothetical protein
MGELGDGELGFELADDEVGDARAQLLERAAAALDERAGHLAPGRRAASEEGKLARAFSEDRARLALPEVLPLNLEALGIDPQVRREDILERWQFYLVTFPIELWARQGWGFNQLQFRAEFNPDDDEARRPRVHDAVPSQEWATVASAHLDLQMGVRADFKFAAKLPTGSSGVAAFPADVQAAVHAIASADAGFTLKPSAYQIRVPRVRRTSVGWNRSHGGLKVGRWSTSEIRACAWF